MPASAADVEAFLDEELSVPLDEQTNLQNFRLTVQAKIYDLLDRWTSEARASTASMSEGRNALLDATVYGNFRSVAYANHDLNTTVKDAVESLLRITGQFDTPAQVEAGLAEREGTAPPRHKALTDLDKLDGPARDRVRQMVATILSAAVSLTPPIQAVNVTTQIKRKEKLRKLLEKGPLRVRRPQKKATDSAGN